MYLVILSHSNYCHYVVFHILSHSVYRIVVKYDFKKISLTLMSSRHCSFPASGFRCSISANPLPGAMWAQ